MEEAGVLDVRVGAERREGVVTNDAGLGDQAARLVPLSAVDGADGDGAEANDPAAGDEGRFTSSILVGEVCEDLGDRGFERTRIGERL